MSRRQQRLNQQLRQEISDLLLREVKDPRLVAIVTITEVAISPDMRHADVFISVLGEEEQKRTVMERLEAASGFFRRELSQRLAIRYIPELEFKRDDRIERGAHLLELLKQVSSPREEKTREK